MKQWIIHGRFTFDGHALVEAETEQEAKAVFDSGQFEFDHPTASICDWERRGMLSPKEELPMRHRCLIPGLIISLAIALFLAIIAVSAAWLPLVKPLLRPQNAATFDERFGKWHSKSLPAKQMPYYYRHNPTRFA
jgi:hypothetical protein